jgi:hypothetical protein
MLNYRRWIFAVVALLWPAAAWPAECTDETAIWASPERDGVRHVLYGTGGITMFSAVFIEEWRDGKRAWRTAAATTSCSNGEVVCRVYFEDETPSDDPEHGRAAAIIERIDENDDGLSEWVVLAGLAAELYYGGGAKVEWDDGFKPEEFERPAATNIYKFLGCRKDPIALDRSTLFADDPLCSTFKASGSLEADQNAPSEPGSVWWMTGERIEGAQLHCQIQSFNKDATITAACGEGPADTPRQTIFKFDYQGVYVVVGEQRLEICE